MVARGSVKMAETSDTSSRKKNEQKILKKKTSKWRALGFGPAPLSARLKDGPPEPSRTDELAGSPGDDLAPPPPSRQPPRVKGQRDTSIHLSPALYSCWAADVGDGETRTAARRTFLIVSGLAGMVTKNRKRCTMTIVIGLL